MGGENGKINSAIFGAQDFYAVHGDNTEHDDDVDDEIEPMKILQEKKKRVDLRIQHTKRIIMKALINLF